MVHTVFASTKGQVVNNQCCYFGLGLFLDLDGVGIPLGLGPIPVAVWAVDDGEIGLLTGLGM